MQYVGIFLKLFSWIFKILKFIGAWWVIVLYAPVWIGEIFVGGGNMPKWIENVCWGLTCTVGLALMILTTIQNIIRIVRKDNKFNIFKSIYSLITGKKATVGTVAKSTKENLLTSNNLHGVVFGKEKDKYFIKNEDEQGSVLIIGGARSGKGSGIIIPSLKSWQGGFFVIDIKGELYNATAKDRDINYVKKFNPCEAGTSGYNPYYALQTARNIVHAVQQISFSIIPPSNDSNQAFWIGNAQDFLTGAILYYYEFEYSFSETMIALKQKPAKETVAYIMESDNEKAKGFISQFVGMDDKTLGGIFAEVSKNINIFATDDDLINALNGKGDCITPQNLEDGYDIYCCIEQDLLDQWRPLMTLICNQFFKFFETRKLEKDGTCKGKPLLFMLDEFPSLGRVESIMGALSTLPGRNIHLALVIQSKSHLNAIYGKDNANIITDNCNYKAILKAAESETMKWCAELVGKYDKEKLSSNYNADVMGMSKGTGQGRTTEQRYIIEPSDFQYLAENGKLVVLAPSGYKMLEKIKWWEDKTFNKIINQA
jgi:type IV secretion system protein VirD4